MAFVRFMMSAEKLRMDDDGGAKNEIELVQRRSA
jgi:hypothetical protein